MSKRNRLGRMSLSRPSLAASSQLQALSGDPRVDHKQVSEEGPIVPCRGRTPNQLPLCAWGTCPTILVCVS